VPPAKPLLAQRHVLKHCMARQCLATRPTFTAQAKMDPTEVAICSLVNIFSGLLTEQATPTRARYRNTNTNRISTKEEGQGVLLARLIRPLCWDQMPFIRLTSYIGGGEAIPARSIRPFRCLYHILQQDAGVSECTLLNLYCRGH